MGLKLLRSVSDLWRRHNSDDFLFVYLVLINQYVGSVPQVRTQQWGTGANTQQRGTGANTAEGHGVCGVCGGYACVCACVCVCLSVVCIRCVHVCVCLRCVYECEVCLCVRQKSGMVWGAGVCLWWGGGYGAERESGRGSGC